VEEDEKAPVQDEKVLVLTDKNFDDELKKHEFLLVEFYAPWCGHCKSLAPEYAKAAEILLNEHKPIYLAKVDATENTELAKRYEIEGFPTLKFYKKGEFVEYTGGRTTDEIVSWIRKKTGPATKELKSAEEVESFNSSSQVTVVYFTDDTNSEEFKIFANVADSYDDVLFGHCPSPKCGDSFKVPSSKIVLFKQFDEKRNDFTDSPISEETFKAFIDSNAIPLVSQFTDRAAEHIFGKNKVAAFYFRSEDSPDHLQHDLKIKNVAQKFKGKIFFVNTDIKGDLEERLAEYFAITQEMLPHFRVTDVKGEEDVFNYVYENGSFSESSIEKFLNDFLEGKLSPYLKSDPVPEEQKGPVHVIVGKTFQKDVIESNKSVFVEFYAPWCGHCKKLEPIWDQLGEKFKDSEDVLIAKMDATTNDVNGVAVSGFPTIKFYPKGDKQNPIDYSGEREYDDLLKFINDQINPPKEEEEGTKNETSGDKKSTKEKKVDL